MTVMQFLLDFILNAYLLHVGNVSKLSHEIKVISI